MKILYLITKSESGGAQTHVFQLAKGFKEKGSEVAIMSFPGGWLQQRAESLGVKFYANNAFGNSLNPWKIYLAIGQINQAIKDFKPDIIHCHSSMAGVAGRIAAWVNKVPAIFTAHGWSFNEGVPMMQKIAGILSEKLAALFCFKIISVADFVTELGLKYKIAPREKFITVYNGIEVNEKIPNKPEGKIKIVMVARLAEPKDPILFLSAFADLKQELKEISEVIIIGGGPKLNEAKEFVQKNILDKYVQLTGEIPRENIFPILEQSHIFVLPSKWEGFPYTIIEAMNYGLASIASDVGGIKEALSGDCGLVLPNDQKQWSLALSRLLADRIMVEDMGLRAWAKAKQEFSLEKMLIRIEKIYQEALNSRDLKR